MILKISILAVYLAAIIKLGMKWKKCRFVIEGNELLFLLLIFPLVLLLPSSVPILALRVGVQVSLWGVGFFWYTLFPKEMKRVTLCIAFFMLVLPVMDYINSLLGGGRTIFVMSIYFVWCCHFVTFMLWSRSEKFARNLLSLEKISRAMQGGLLLSVISVGAVIFLCSHPGNVISCISVVLLSLFPLLGLLRHYKPQCLLYNERMELRRKAYLLGRTLKGVQELEDEGAIINECVVEDVRIIYTIITLFEKEKLYLNSEIKIVDVAKRVGTNKTYLSRALNTRLSKNFCQFVNHFRVRDACMLYLKNPDQDMRPLAEQCGFSSQSTFSMVFKATTGYTPGDWSRMIKLKLVNDEKVKVEDYLL